MAATGLRAELLECRLADYLSSHPGEQPTPEQNELRAAVLRLARIRQPRNADPLIDATIAVAAAGGATIGLEARVWAAIDLLGQNDPRGHALELTDQITAELEQRTDLGTVGHRWRLLLAFHAGRAGYPAIAQQLLTPMLNAQDSAEDKDAAQAVLYAVGGPGADTRLQIVGLEAELAVLPPGADDDRLRIHHALATDYGDLGDYQRALHHSQQELPLRRRIQGPDSPDTLITRYDIAFWTGESGHPAEALRLSQQLLPDMERVLGPDHPRTLTTRSDVAFWTGESGHPAEALQLFRQLLPDQERVLGRDDLGTLTTRNNIAAITGESGHPAEALELSQQLLPDHERVLGPDHPRNLSIRHNIAVFTGQSGHPAEALRLFQQLLPHMERVLGPDHPETLATRYNIADLTGQSGHPAEALRLFQQLLPHMERVLGPDHPRTLTTRGDVAFWTGQS